MRLKLCSRLCLLLLLLSSAYAQSGIGQQLHWQDVIVEAVNPALYLLPRQSAELVLRFENRSSQRQQLRPSVHLPAGWLLLSPLPRLQLAPGEVRSESFSILVADRTPGGSYQVEVRLTPDSVTDFPTLEQASLRFQVQIQGAGPLEANVLQAPSAASEDYVLRFRLRNNAERTLGVRLRAEDNLGYTLSLEPDEAIIAAEQNLEVRVSVSVPSDISDVLEHRVRLIVESSDSSDSPDSGIQTFAQSRVQVADAERISASPSLRFPLEAGVRSRGAISQGRSDDPETLARNIEVSLSGSGSLSERDEDTLSLELRNSLAEQYNLAVYQSPTFRIALGNQNFLFSSLSAGGRDFGLDLQTIFFPSDNFGIYLGGFASPPREDGRFGVRAAFPILRSLEITLQAVVPMSLDNPSLIGGRLQLFPEVPWRGSANLSIEYNVQTSAEGLPGSSAFRIQGSVGATVGGLQLSYEQRGAGYGIEYSPRDERRLSSARLAEQALESYRLDVGADIRLQEDSPVQAQLRFSQEGFYPEGALLEGEPVQETTQGSARIDARINALDMRLELDSLRREAQGAASSGLDNQVRFGVDLFIQDTIPLEQSLAWLQQRDLGEEDVREALEYSVSSSIPIALGSLRPSLVAALGLREGSGERLRVGLDWSAVLLQRLELLLGSRLSLGEDSIVSFNAQARYQLGDSNGQQALTFALRGDIFSDRALDMAWELGYQQPFALSIGQRAQVGSLRGSILDENSQGIADIVVQLADVTTRSQADGSYSFPALAAGRYFISLHTGVLNDRKVTIPATPLQVEILADTEQQLNLQVVQVAQIIGNIRSGLSPEQRAALGIDEPAALLAGFIIELSRNGQVLRTLSNAQGLFQFDNLSPGLWQLRVLRGNLPDGLSLSPEVQLLELGSGETVRPEVLILANP